jgi:hypothetical protein
MAVARTGPALFSVRKGLLASKSIRVDACPRHAADTEVNINNFTFTPNKLTVKQGPSSSSAIALGARFRRQLFCLRKAWKRRVFLRPASANDG